MVLMYCWPSALIRHGASLVIARKVVKTEFKCTFVTGSEKTRLSGIFYIQEIPVLNIQATLAC